MTGISLKGNAFSQQVWYQLLSQRFDAQPSSLWSREQCPVGMVWEPLARIPRVTLDATLDSPSREAVLSDAGLRDNGRRELPRAEVMATGQAVGCYLPAGAHAQRRTYLLKSHPAPTTPSRVGSSVKSPPIPVRGNLPQARRRSPCCVTSECPALEDVREGTLVKCPSVRGQQARGT